jgi:hypothetical protein
VMNRVYILSTAALRCQDIRQTYPGSYKAKKPSKKKEK